jgi:hypothetical protein
MNWLPSSLDLNPIENIWAMLKHASKIEQENQLHNPSKWAGIAQEEREQIDRQKVYWPIESMPRGVQTVIK